MSTRSALPAADSGGPLDIDYFAGGGGVSMGFEMATGKAMDLAVNHCPLAIAMHTANHPNTRHLTEDVWKVDIEAETMGRPVRTLWGSPDCRHFSRARGGKPVVKKIRGLAWVLINVLKVKRPRFFFLENVREFQDWGPLLEDQKPDPAKKGRTFKQFVGRIRGLGYSVEWMVLNAADYGAPTHRRRLVLIARRDGAVVWPVPTHGPGRALPWRTAAECIDWSLECPSIFTRKRPLADKTLRRIAMGLKRYVLENPRPFIVPFVVNVQHGKDEFRGQAIDQPLSTVAAKHGYGVVAPTLVQTGYGEREGQAPRALNIEAPLGAVVGGGQKHALVSAFCSQFFGGMVGKPLTDPLPPTTGKGPHEALVTAAIVNIERSYKDESAQAVDAPLGTVTASPKGGKHALVSAALIGVGGRAGQSPPCGVDEPMGTTTAKADRAVAAAYVTRFNNHGECSGDVNAPLGTIAAQGGGGKFGLVYAFLVKYFGTAIGQAADESLHTQTAKPRFGVVEVQLENGTREPALVIEVDGVGPCIIADIGLRMLTPRELARAQGFPDSYVLTGTIASQVARIGNSVPPPLAEAVIRANVMERAPEVAA